MTLVALVVAVGAVLVVRAARQPSRADLDRFATLHGVRLSEVARWEVAAHLRRARVLRAAGAVTGLTAGSLYQVLNDGQALGLGGWWLPLVGYMAGAAAAEVRGLRMSPGGPRAAALSPRTLTRYLPGWTILGLRVLPLLPLLVLWRWGSGAPAELVPPAVAALLSAAGTGLLLHAAVRRSRPALSPDLLSAEEALRSSSVHVLSGAGLAAQLVLLSAQLSVVGNLPPIRDGGTGWVWWALSLVLLGLALGCWRDLTHPHGRPQVPLAT